MPVYLTLQPAGCAAAPVARRPGGLLPRLFTLACPAKGRAVVFCHIIPDVAAGFPLRNAVLCVARTFLFMSIMRHRATDRISVMISFFLFLCKVSEFMAHAQTKGE